MKNDTTVILVDDDESVRRATGRLLRSEGYAIRAFASAEEFLSQPPCGEPCCLVLDYHMPGLSGLQLQEMLVKSGRHIPIVFITGHGDVPLSVKAMKQGAVDFLSKPFKADDLQAAVETALKKSLEIKKGHERKESAARIFSGLTPAEHQVMRWVLTGLLNKQIADKLGITEKTVKVHRGQVMHKLKVSSVAELVRLAQQADITPAKA